MKKEIDEEEILEKKTPSSTRTPTRSATILILLSLIITTRGFISIPPFKFHSHNQYIARTEGKGHFVSTMQTRLNEAQVTKLQLQVPVENTTQIKSHVVSEKKLIKTQTETQKQAPPASPIVIITSKDSLADPEAVVLKFAGAIIFPNCNNIIKINNDTCFYLHPGKTLKGEIILYAENGMKLGSVKDWKLVEGKKNIWEYETPNKTYILIEKLTGKVIYLGWKSFNDRLQCFQYNLYLNTFSKEGFLIQYTPYSDLSNLSISFGESYFSNNRNIFVKSFEKKQIQRDEEYLKGCQ